MALFNRDAKYEVQVYRDNRWAIDDVVTDEKAAIKQAEGLLKRPNVEGVRVIAEWKGITGGDRDKEIFKKMGEGGKNEDFTPATVDEAPVCTSARDLLGAASRGTIMRMFSKYLEKQQITPMEMLHHHKNLKRMVNFETMVPAGVDKIATLQARTAKLNAKDRKNWLFDAVDEISSRAKAAEAAKLPDMGDGGLDELVDKLAAKFREEDEHRYMVTTAFVRTSLGWRGWLGKLDRLLGFATRERHALSLAIVDDMICDTLSAKTSMRDLLGPSASLGQAINRMLDLLQGRCKNAPGSADDILGPLNKLFRDGKLPGARRVLTERITRDLAGGVKLSANKPDQEEQVFKDLLDRLITEESVFGGGKMAHSVTERCARLHNVGGAGGRRKAVTILRDQLAQPKRVFLYLLALLEEDDQIDDEMYKHIAAQVEAVLEKLSDINSIAPHAKSDPDRMKQAVQIQKAVLDSHLRNPLKTKAANTFDDIVSRYIIDAQVIEHFDKSDLPLRQRATRLVNFCAAGYLTQGKATDIARNRVTAYLKRPDFIAALTADVADPAEKEKTIRDFYAQLARAGFGPL